MSSAFTRGYNGDRVYTLEEAYTRIAELEATLLKLQVYECDEVDTRIAELEEKNNRLSDQIREECDWKLSWQKSAEECQTRIAELEAERLESSDKLYELAHQWWDLEVIVSEIQTIVGMNDRDFLLEEIGNLEATRVSDELLNNIIEILNITDRQNGWDGVTSKAKAIIAKRKEGA